MTHDEYNQLFHRAHVNEVAFKRVMDCDEELRKMVEMAVAHEREECAKLCDYRVGIWIIPAGPAECAAAIRRRGEK